VVRQSKKKVKNTAPKKAGKIIKIPSREKF
jgi:hypothetical protein